VNNLVRPLAKFYAWVLFIAALLLLVGRLGISHGVNLSKPSDLLYFLQLAIMFFTGYSLHANSNGKEMKYDALTFLLLVGVQASLLLFAYGGISEINDLPIFYPLIYLLIFIVNLMLIYSHFNFYRDRHKEK
jgi:hypothetical protein